MKSEKKIFKKVAVAVVILYMAVLMIPSLVYTAARGTDRPDDIQSTEEINSDNLQERIPKEKEQEEIFNIYDTSEGEVLQVPKKEFLTRAIATEMDLFAPREALKAQAVAIYTFYTREQAISKLDNADFTCDTEKWLVYTTKEQMKSRWGEDFEKYYSVLEDVANEVYGQMIIKDGEPICSSFFAISAGNTQDVADVWQSELSYLRPVASPSDVFFSGYMSYVNIDSDRVAKLLESAYAGGSGSAGEDFFQDISVNASGYVQSLSAGGVTLSGSQVRTALGLRSAAFDIEFNAGVFTFTVRGWGHGVGMSQAGAISMAEEGADYRQILSYFYPGCDIVP